MERDMNRRTTRRWLAGLAVAVVGAAGLAGALPVQADPPEEPPPPPPPQAVVIAIDFEQADTGVTLNGQVTAADGTNPPGLILYIYLDNVPQGQTMTGAMGSFTTVLPLPAVGVHHVRVEWPGDSVYLAANSGMEMVIKPPPKLPTTLTASLDPRTANPGMPVMISGKLMADKTPLGAVRLTLKTDYGNLDGMAVTADDGTYSATMSLPDGKNFPGGFTVTVTYSGDSVYEKTSVTVSGSITGKPKPTATPTATPTGTASTTPSATASPTGPTTGPSSTLSGGSGPTGNTLIVDPERWSAVRSIFLAVAGLGVGAVVVLGVISFSRKRLARDERRGFGTDFGRAH